MRITSRYTARRGLRRRRATLSRNRARSARRVGRVRMASSAATKSRKESAFTANATPSPNAAMTAAAASGPTARARLYVTELRATACGSSSSATSEPTSAICAGCESAAKTPRRVANAITIAVVAAPLHVIHVSTAVVPAARLCVTMSSFRRSTRSARPPVHGARTRHGRELAEVEDAEQERRVRQPVDEDRRGEVLEPGAAGGGGVPDEVRAEVPLTQDAPGRPGAGGFVGSRPGPHES